MLFPTPAHLVCFYDPLFYARTVRFHRWQVDIHRDFAQRAPDSSKQIIVVAPNGAGKSAMILGPQACWTAMSFLESITAVTSASGAQLDTQTMPAIKRIAEHVNRYHRSELFVIRSKQIDFHPQHSPIIPRKSGEEGTQEGFHPISPGGEFTILVDEGKSMSEEIYNGIAKWTGWTRRTDISSAGEPMGVFYRLVTEGPVEPYIITDEMCPNITDSDRALIYAQGGGPDSILARQSLKSQFVALAGSTVLTLDAVNKAVRAAKENKIPWVREPENKCGLDLSGGGDEIILAIGNGNKLLKLEKIIAKETTYLVERIISLCKAHDLNNPAKRKADAGGLGKPILDLLARAGWPFVRVYNQSKPIARGRFNFGNRGTDMWFRFARMVEDCGVILLDDPKLTFQLSNRFVRHHAQTDKIILQPKQEARAQGLPSPDRADAVVLCFEGWAAPEQRDEKKKKLTKAELEQWYDDLTEGNFMNPAKLDGTITLEQLVGMRTQPKKLMR